MATTNLGITYVVASQDQKEVTINAGFQALDVALNSATTVDCGAGGTVVVPAASYVGNLVLKLIGTPGGDFNLTVPNTGRLFVVWNTTGSTATVGATGGGTTYAVADSTAATLVNVGSNLVLLNGGGGGGGGGGVSSITAGSGLSGGTITVSGTIAIATAGITNAMLATMLTGRFKGNVSGSTASPADLTAAQVAAALPAVVGDTGSGGTKGLVPAPGSGDAAAGKYLAADGTWSAPAGSGSATLAGESDVSITSPADKDFLVYVATASRWENIGHATATADLDAMVGDSGSGGTKGLVPAPGSGDTAAGKFLKADGTWDVPVPGTSTLAGDSDVGITTPASDDFLAYNSGTTKWTNRTKAAALALLAAFIGDSGSGGTKGLVPAPGAGDAAAGKFLGADGSWDVPAATSGVADMQDFGSGSTFTAILTNAKTHVLVNSATGGTKTVTIPAASGYDGYEIALSDYIGTCDVSNVIVVSPVSGTVFHDTTMTLQSRYATAVLRAYGAGNAWVLTSATL